MMFTSTSPSKTKYMKKIVDVLLMLQFIPHMMVSSISNYSANSFILKSISITILLLTILLHSRIYKVRIKAIYTFEQNRILYLTLLFFLLIPIISLTYSLNAEFGQLKVLALSINTIPTIVAFKYLVDTIDEEKFATYLYTLLTISVLSSIFVILATPFNYDGSYSIGLSDWSHVVFGRFISSAVFITALVIIYRKDSPLLIKAAFIISVIGLVLTQFRGGLVSIATVMFVIIIEFVSGRKFTDRIIKTSALLGFVIIFTGLYYLAKDNTRYESMMKDITSESYADGPILARERAYKYSLESIWKRPWIGSGAGGFYSEEVGKNVMEIKYPHNLVLEIGVEYGIPVLVLFLIFLKRMFIKQYKYHPVVFYFFLFAFMLAMFSKDLPNQPFYLIGLVFLTNKKSD